MSDCTSLRYKVLSEAANLGCEEEVKSSFDRFEEENFKIFDLENEREILELFVDFSRKTGFFSEVNVVVESILSKGIKTHSEEETRKRILKIAKLYGVDVRQVKSVFKKYDSMLAGVKTDSERAEIAKMGAIEIHSLLDVSGPLVIDGVEIVPKKRDHVEDINNGVRLISE